VVRVTDWVVSPLLHEKEEAPEHVSVTELPGQKVVGPDAVMDALPVCDPESLTSSMRN